MVKKRKNSLVTSVCRERVVSITIYEHISPMYMSFITCDTIKCSILENTYIEETFVIVDYSSLQAYYVIQSPEIIMNDQETTVQSHFGPILKPGYGL